MNERRLAALLMIAQAPLFAIETGVVHRIGSSASVVQLSLLRSLGGLILVLALARLEGRSFLRTDRLCLQLIRGSLAAGYFWVMMYSFGRLPFADATAISYTQAAYIAIFSASLLHERVSVLRWTAAGVGLIGALLIIKPVFHQWNAAYLIALFGTSLNGLVFILSRDLQRDGGDGALTTMFFVNAVPAIFNLPLAIMTPLPDQAVWPWLLGVVVLGPAGVYCGTTALRYADASTLGPYTFLRLPMGVIGGILIFHEIPDLAKLFGIALIVASCGHVMTGGWDRWRVTALFRAKPAPTITPVLPPPVVARTGRALRRLERPGERSSVRSESPVAAR